MVTSSGSIQNKVGLGYRQCGFRWCRLFSAFLRRKMVRENNNGQDSDSDWDSLTSVPQPAPRIRVLSDDDLSPTTRKILPHHRDLVNELGDEDPLYGETVRAYSNESSLRASSSGNMEGGPLTIIDRHADHKSMSSDSGSMDESQQSAPSVDDGRNGSVDVEHVQVKVAEKEQTKNSAFQQHQSRSSDDSRSCPTMLPFDNMAFTFPGGDVNDAEPNNWPQSAQVKLPSAEHRAAQFPRPDETIEIFSFDKGNTGFYQVTEKRRRPLADNWNEQLFQTMSQFWAEITSIIGLPFMFVLALVLQLLRFVSIGLVRPLLIGLLAVFSDGLIKPTLTSVFNAVIQPLGIFFYNVGLCVQLAATPLARTLHIVVHPLGHLLRSFRLVDVHLAPRRRLTLDDV